MEHNISASQLAKLKVLMPEIFNLEDKIDVDLFRKIIGDENISNSPVNDCFEPIFQNSPNPEYIFDEQTLKFLSVNKAAIKFYGFSLEEFQSMTLEGIRLKEDIPQLHKRLSNANFTSKFPDIIRHRRKDGKLVYVEVSFTSLDFKGHKAKHVIVSDITSIIESGNKTIEETLFWLNESQRIGKIGSYQFFIQKGYWESSIVLDQLFGIEHKKKKTLEEWIGLIHPLDREMMVEYLQSQVLTGKQQFNKEYRILKPDGDTIWVWGIGNLSFNPAGEPVKMTGTIQDISARKENENLVIETKQNYESFFNTVDDFLFVLDHHGGIIHVNDTVVQRLGFDKSELIGHSILNVHPQGRREEAAKVVGEMLVGKTNICQIPIITKDGHEIPVETRISEGVWGGKPAIFGVVKDISKLKLSEEKFSKSFHLNPSACGFSEFETGIYIEINNAFCELFGYTREETIGKTAFELGIMDKSIRNHILSHSDENGCVRNVETDVKTKNGILKRVILSSESIQIQDKQYRYTVVHDITDTINAIEALHKSEEKFRLLAENSTDAIWTMNLEGKYEYISPSIYRLRGYTYKEVLSQDFTQAIAPGSQEIAKSIFSEAVAQLKAGQKAESKNLQLELIHKEGHTIWTEINIDIIYDENGQFKYFLGVTRNIDKRKRAENALRAREEQLNTLINATPDFICFKDGQGRWQITNKRGIEIFDLEGIDYVGKTDLELSTLSNESNKANHNGCTKSDQEAWANRAAYNVEEIVQKSDGSSIILDIIKIPLFEENGEKKGLVILGRDITERKKINDAIEESREKYRTLSNASFESIFVSENGVCIEQNKTAELTFGYTTEEALGRYGTEWIVPEDREMVIQKMKVGNEEPYEARALRKDGSTFPCILRGRMMTYKGKDVRITSLTDISLLKKTEEAFRQSERKYQLIFENSPFGIILFDNEGVITDCNEQFEKVIGSSKKRLIGLEMLQLPNKKLVNTISNTLHGSTSTYEGEYKSVTAEKTTPVNGTFAPIKDDNNHIIGGVGIIEDVTQRKIAETNLIESERRYKALYQTSPSGIIVLDENGIIQEVNNEIIKTTQYAADELIGEHIVKLTSPDKMNQVKDHIKRILNGEIVESDVQNVKKDGSYCYFHLKETVITLSNGKKGILSVSNDITARKVAEDKLKENEMILRSIIDNEPECIKIVDKNGKLIMMNQAGLRMFEAESFEEIERLSLINQISPEFRKPFMRLHEKVLSGQSGQMSFEIVGLKGSKRWLETNAIPMVINGEKVQMAVTRDISERKKAEEELLNNEISLRKALIESSALLNDESENIEYDKIAETIRALSGARYVAINLFDQNGREFTTVAIGGVNDKAVKLSTYLGFDIINKKWKYDSQKADKIKDNTITRFSKLHHLTGKALPRTVVDLLERTFHLGEVNIVKINKQNKIIGDFTLLFSKGENLQNSELVTLYANQVGLFIERKFAINALKDNERILRQAQEVSRIGSYVFDLQSGSWHSSEVLNKILGINDDYIRNLESLNSIIAPEYRDQIIRNYKETVKSQKNFEMEFKIIRPSDGEERWVSALGQIDYDKAGKAIRQIGTIQNITERKKAQIALEESEHKFRLIAEKTSDGILVLNAEGKATYASPSYNKISGYSEDENYLHNAQSIYSIIHPDDRDELFAKIYNAIEQKQDGLIYSYRAIHKNGHYIWREDNAKFNYDSQGNHTSSYVICRDISERKSIEDALVESERKFSSILENSPYHIWAFDGERFTYVNKAYFDFSGDDESTVLNLAYISPRIHPEDLEHWIQVWGLAIDSKTEHDNYFRMKNKDGEYRNFWSHATPVVDAENKFSHFQGFNIDITDRLLLEKQYSLLFNQMLDGFALHEIITDENDHPIDYKIIAVNPSYEHQTGLKASEITGKTIREISPDTEQIWIELYGEVALTGHPTSFESYNASVGKHFQVTAFSPAHKQFACLFTDITSRKDAEIIIRSHQEKLEELVQVRTKELLERDTYLSSIIDNHPGMFWMKDINGRFIFTNKANSRFLRTVYGEDANTIIGKTDADFCPPYQTKVYEKEDREVVKNKKEIHSEDKIIIGTKEMWFEKMKFPVINQDNAIIGVAGYSIDITERIKRDGQLRMQSEAFQSFAMSIVITDKNGQIEWVNDAFEKLTGFTSKEVVGAKANMLKSGKMEDAFYKKLWFTINAGLVWEGEFINRRKDGTLYFEESTITPVRDHDGIISHFIAIKMDITHRKEMEEALRVSDERWQFAIEGSGDGVYDFDLRTRKLFFSNQWKSLLGFNEDEIGDTIYEWTSRIHPEDLERYLEETNQFFKGKAKTFSNEYRMICKDRSPKWVLTRGIVVERDEKQDPVRIIGTLSDITDIKRLEESLRKNIEKERELNEIKSRFVATASHEFRTPLASIMITNESLINYWERMEKEQIKTKLEKIKSNVTFLTNIVNDVLQLSKIQEGKLEFRSESIDIIALTQTIVNEFSDDATKSPIEFKTDVPSLFMNLDERLIRQSLNNLISNAQKYSVDNTPVEITMTVKNSTLKISVKDHGIGIPENDQKHLFTPFYRASNSRMIQGNGLGLNIVKESIKMHGGDITFVSKPNIGTIFTLQLPIISIHH